MRALTALMLSPALLIAFNPVMAGVRSKQPCAHSEPRSLELDYRGVRSVRFDVNTHQLRITPTTASVVTLSGRACASSPKKLSEVSRGRSVAGLAGTG